MAAPKSSRGPHSSSARFRRTRLLLGPVATRVIEGTLSISRDTKVLIVSDAAHKSVAEVLVETCHDRRALVELIVLEELGPRPHRVLPVRVMGLLARCDASIFLADFVDGEASMRRELLLVAQRYRVRHAHIIGLDVDTLIAGLQTDPREMKRLGMLVRSKLKGKRSIHVTSPSGTDLTVTLDSHYKWAVHSGIIAPGTWENLPSGELMTHPADVHGKYVCDVTFSGPVGARQGYLRTAPISLQIEHGRVTNVTASHRELKQHIEEWMASGQDYDLVGVVTIGLNVGISRPTGAIICDQNIPGLHISLGSTFPEETGADWDTDGQMVFAGEQQDIDVDGVPLMRLGQFLHRI